MLCVKEVSQKRAACSVLVLRSQLLHPCPTATAIVRLAVTTVEELPDQSIVHSAAAYAGPSTYVITGVAWDAGKMACWPAELAVSPATEEEGRGCACQPCLSLLRLRCRRRGKSKGALPDQPSFTGERESDSQGAPSIKKGCRRAGMRQELFFEALSSVHGKTSNPHNWQENTRYRAQTIFRHPQSRLCNFCAMHLRMFLVQKYAA